MGEASGTQAAASANTSYGGAAITAAGGLYRAYSEYESGQYNQSAADINARLAERQGRQAVKAGVSAINLKERQLAQVQGAGRAAAAGSGVVAGAGSNRAVMASNAAVTHMDETMIALNARRQAYGFAVQAEADRQAGDLAEAEGKQRAVGTLLNTAGQEWHDWAPQHIDLGSHGVIGGDVPGFDYGGTFEGYGSGTK